VVDSEADAAAYRRHLADLFNQYSGALTRFAVRRVGEAAAPDVVSETFLVAWRRRREIPADRAGAWLFTVADYVISHEIRGSRRRTALTERTALEAEASAPANGDEAAQIAERLLVRQTLAQLSPQDQEALRLAEWDQLNTEEAAAVLKCSAAAFKVRLHRARRRFAARLLKAQAEHPSVESGERLQGLLGLSRPAGRGEAAG
jgi:RNA polymerase sigma-70 factor, ECF subfamily